MITKSLRLNLKLVYQLTHRMMICPSKCRPLNSAWPGKTKRGKNYAKPPEPLEAVKTGQQRPMPPGFRGGSLRATSISCDRCGRSRFSRGSENPSRQPTRFQADPWYSLSTEGSPVGLWAFSVILSSFRLPWPTATSRARIVIWVLGPDADSISFASSSTRSLIAASSRRIRSLSAVVRGDREAMTY